MGILRRWGGYLPLRWLLVSGLFLSPVCLSLPAKAGPYHPEAGEAGSTAIHMDDPAFVAWATGWEDYVPGEKVYTTFQTPEKAMGKAAGNASDIVSLGRGGEITLTFSPPIENGQGWDFAVFENSFSHKFLELAYVEVSSGGMDFVRFPNDSLTPEPVSGFGAVEPTDIDGLAGKYEQGYGTPFDLEDVGLHEATHVRLVDIVGDASCVDTGGDIIYDPYPTVGSAGFDLDAIGVSGGAAYPNGEFLPPEPTPPEEPPLHNGKAGFGGGGGCFVATSF